MRSDRVEGSQKNGEAFINDRFRSLGVSLFDEALLFFGKGILGNGRWEEQKKSIYRKYFLFTDFR